MSNSSNMSVSSRGTSQPAALPVRFVDRLSDVVAFFGAAGVVLLVLNVVVDVIGRLAFHRPFPGTVEYTTYWWMPMLALLAFAYTEKRQEHIKVTILLDALPWRMRQIVDGMFGLIGTALIVALTIFAWEDAMKAYNFQEVTASSPPVAIWPFRFVAVIAMGALALQSAVTSYRYFAGHLPALHDDKKADIA